MTDNEGDSGLEVTTQLLPASTHLPLDTTTFPHDGGGGLVEDLTTLQDVQAAQTESLTTLAQHTSAVFTSLSTTSSSTSSPSTTLSTTVIGQHDKHTVSDASVTSMEVEWTASGIPMSMMWLPYFCFTLALLILMVVSFIHFHRKNGHKYRRRSIQLWRYCSRLRRLLHRLGCVGKRRDSRANAHPNTSHRHHQTVTTIPSPPNGGVNIQQASTSASSKTRTGRRHRRPLTFASNVNGSMVDLRCGTNESMQTFRPKPKPKPKNKKSDKHSHSPSIWTMAMKKDAVKSGNKVRIPSDTEDDEVFLLHQTKL